jgi:general secretion pathway protein B
MSYILDALKKAAEQRGANATVLLRPSTPLARTARLRRLPWMVVGGLLLLNLAGLVYLMRPAAVITPAPQPVSPPKVALIQPIEPPAPPPPTQVIPPEAPPRSVAAVRPVTPAVSPPPAVSAPAVSAPAATRPPRIRPLPGGRPWTGPSATRPSCGSPPSVPRPAHAPRPSNRRPPRPPRPRRPTGASSSEVLSYSDVPAQRLVFINGRRYREGETMDGGVKIEEIREDSVGAQRRRSALHAALTVSRRSLARDQTCSVKDR